MKNEVAITESGAKYFNPEEMRYHAEEYEACMMAMDEAGVPRSDESGVTFSLFGRALYMSSYGIGK
jgi:dihydropteroate synthase